MLVESRNNLLRQESHEKIKKNTDINKVKNCIFPKGLVHGFGKKNLKSRKFLF